MQAYPAGRPYHVSMNIRLFSCSLSPSSRSFRLAEAAQARLRALNVQAELTDLRRWNLPLCDGAAVYEDPQVIAVREQLEQADAILISSPVYNYDASAAAKNLVELTGTAWLNKVVGLIYAAGGKSSYMASLGLANSLMLDFRCLIVPRIVYATREDVGEDGRLNDLIAERLEQLCDQTVRLAGALAGAPAR